MLPEQIHQLKNLQHELNEIVEEIKICKEHLKNIRSQLVLSKKGKNNLLDYWNDELKYWTKELNIYQKLEKELETKIDDLV